MTWILEILGVLFILDLLLMLCAAPSLIGWILDKLGL